MKKRLKIKKDRSSRSSRSSLKKFNSFRDHVKLSTENIELRNLYKRSSSLRSGSRSLRSVSIRSSMKNENINAVTIKNREERQSLSNNDINLNDIAKELGGSRKNIDKEEENRSQTNNRIVFDTEDRIIPSYSSSNNNEINIMNSSSFSRVNTLSKKDEMERERIKQIIKDRESYLNNELHDIENDIAGSEGMFLESGDELDNISDSGL